MHSCHGCLLIAAVLGAALFGEAQGAAYGAKHYPAHAALRYVNQGQTFGSPSRTVSLKVLRGSMPADQPEWAGAGSGLRSAALLLPLEEVDEPFIDALTNGSIGAGVVLVDESWATEAPVSPSPAAARAAQLLETALRQQTLASPVLVAPAPAGLRSAAASLPAVGPTTASASGLARQGVTLQVAPGSSSAKPTVGSVTNFEATFPGGAGKSVLVVGHYDSLTAVPGLPGGGVADAAVAATWLEAVRVTGELVSAGAVGADAGSVSFLLAGGWSIGHQGAREWLSTAGTNAVAALGAVVAIGEVGDQPDAPRQWLHSGGPADRPDGLSGPSQLRGGMAVSTGAAPSEGRWARWEHELFADKGLLAATLSAPGALQDLGQQLLHDQSNVEEALLGATEGEYVAVPADPEASSTGPAAPQRARRRLARGPLPQPRTSFADRTVTDGVVAAAEAHASALVRFIAGRLGVDQPPPVNRTRIEADLRALVRIDRSPSASTTTIQEEVGALVAAAAGSGRVWNATHRFSARGAPVVATAPAGTTIALVVVASAYYEASVGVGVALLLAIIYLGITGEEAFAEGPARDGYKRWRAAAVSTYLSIADPGAIAKRE